MKINFMSSKDSDEKRMHSQNDNVETMTGNNTNEIINELFSSLLRRYQIDLEKSMKGNDFAFDYFGKLYYKCH